MGGHCLIPSTTDSLDPGGPEKHSWALILNPLGIPEHFSKDCPYHTPPKIKHLNPSNIVIF